MNQTTICAARDDQAIQDIAALAKEIWEQHFTPIIGADQVAYMVDKFQSYPALKAQTGEEGYEYYQLLADGKLAGYTGVHQEGDSLFLSKLYIHKDYRGQHLATQALNFLKDLCRERGIRKIWLTCNKHNANTLAIYDHLGFRITDQQVADIGNGFVMDDYILTLEL